MTNRKGHLITDRLYLLHCFKRQSLRSFTTVTDGR